MQASATIPFSSKYFILQYGIVKIVMTDDVRHVSFSICITGLWLRKRIINLEQFSSDKGGDVNSIRGLATLIKRYLLVDTGEAENLEQSRHGIKLLHYENFEIYFESLRRFTRRSGGIRI